MCVHFFIVELTTLWCSSLAVSLPGCAGAPAGQAFLPSLLPCDPSCTGGPAILWECPRPRGATGQPCVSDTAGQEVSRPPAWPPYTSLPQPTTLPTPCHTPQGTRAHTLLRKLLFPRDPQGCGLRALGSQPRMGAGAADVPGAQPHCCGGSWRSERLVGSPARLRTPETPSLRTRCPHCSRPTSSPHRASPGGGCCSRRWQRSPRRTSVSQRRLRRRKRWRAQRRTPGWLRKEATWLAGPGRAEVVGLAWGRGCLFPGWVLGTHSGRGVLDSQHGNRGTVMGVGEAGLRWDRSARPRGRTQGGGRKKVYGGLRSPRQDAGHNLSWRTAMTAEIRKSDHNQCW